MKINNTLLIVGFILSLVALFSLYYFKTPQNVNKVDTVTMTDTVYRTDTLTFFKEKTIPKFIENVRVDTFYTKDGKDTTLLTENKTYIDTLCQKGDTAIIASYISGINAKQDSIRVKLMAQKEIITTTNEITKYVNVKKPFSIGPTITAGYDPINKNWGLMVGIGVSINIW